MKRLRLLTLATLIGLGTIAASTSGNDDDSAQTRLQHQANGVAGWIDSGVDTTQFATGTPLFDAEWVFGTAQMAALGFGQQAAGDPAHATEAIARMEQAIDALLSPEGRAFDRGKWGEDPIESIDGPHGHAAWVGYTNLALSVHRQLVPSSKYAKLNDQLSEALARRLGDAPGGVLETYPGERYPVDTAAGVASLMLHTERAAGAGTDAIHRWKEHYATNQRDPENGLLFQSMNGKARPTDHARGSGTFLGAWFLSFGDPELACALYQDGKDELLSSLGPLVAMREYAPGQDGRMDVDSGPIVGGLGVSATGFAIGAAHACGDEETAAKLTQTAEWIGRPSESEAAIHWKTGVQLGGAPVADAILFAMMSTPNRLGAPTP